MRKEFMTTMMGEIPPSCRGSLRLIASSTVEITVIDALDRLIIGELQRDARSSWRELGERVGLGPTATADRVRRLIDGGIIRSFTTTVDLASLGIGLRAVVDIRLRADAEPDDFERVLSETPEVQSAFHLTGPFDYSVLLSCADVARLDELLRGWKPGAGVEESSTRIVLAEIDLNDRRSPTTPRQPQHVARRRSPSHPR